MCLFLHVAANAPLAQHRWPEFAVAAGPLAKGKPLQAVTLPHVHHVGDPAGCSCCFPSEAAGDAFEFRSAEPSSPEEIAALGRLFELVREGLRHGDRVELWPAWAGEEGEPALGTIELRAAALDPARFVFCERFLHVVHR